MSDAVGFDLDMTLIDSRPGIAATYRALTAKTGVHVDADLVKRFDRVLGSAGHGRDLKGGITFDHARQHGPRDHRIVDDHQADAAALRAGRLVAVPRSGERPLHVQELRRRRRAAA